MLRIGNIRKRYGEHVIFQGLHHRFGAGCVALCDENGSGKSTLLGILAGTVDADEGDVWINGHSLREAPFEAKSSLAYVPDDCMAYPFQTGREFLEFVASTKKTVVDHVTLEVAHRFGLAPHLEKRFEQMSLGTRKKIFLSAVTLGKPSVIVADEPSNGLDAAARGVLMDMFRTLAEDRVVFFSSHDPEFTEGCRARTISFADLGAVG
ncbi:ABC transporter ATP-binding protein [Burkholderia cenocepacia]|uniref:ABC transporter ATP-binding protein n=1 Tax=Burkholderia cenocepacia TaxID=95486 RepID=UPI001589618C|nr:ABC transporter ATP-binding protein [Burkholderia cenocepacia]MBR8413404.1 ABC transporter ATP-binding protein [Burkholderia cenocepacia]HEB3531730.1 ABC transporter ATP-binding protein [Burkholderia cenocepacia]